MEGQKSPTKVGMLNSRTIAPGYITEARAFLVSPDWALKVNGPTSIHLFLFNQLEDKMYCVSKCLNHIAPTISLFKKISARGRHTDSQ